MILEMHLWSRKSPLICESHPDLVWHRGMLRDLLPLCDGGYTATFADKWRSFRQFLMKIFEGYYVSRATNRCILVLIWITLEFIPLQLVFSNSINNDNDRNA